MTRLNSTASFLYHSRTLTLFSSPLRPQFNHKFTRSFSTQNSSTESNSQVNKSSTENNSTQNASEEPIGSSSTSPDAPKPRRSFLQKRAASISSRRPSTPRPFSPTTNPNKIAPKITPQEKLVFGGLLEQLGVQHDGISAKVGSGSKPLSPEKQAEIAELMSVFDSLLQDPQKKKAALKALRQQKNNPRSTRSPEKSETKEETSQENKGPRQIKLSDLGYHEAATASAAEFTISVSKAIEMVIERESEHIEFALFQAVEQGKGDMGVWEVCKERVFSMLHHLDEKTFAEASDVNLSASDQSKTPSTSPSGPLRIPSVVPASPVVAGLYPKALLIAFRILNTHFPKSPLISQFHSTIKEHGRISALLGASSGLYDELMFYHWRGCKDLPAVISILREMNQLGVSPSSKSRGLLTSLIIRQGRDLEAHKKSPDGKEFFWDLPSNKEAFDELTRTDGWMDKIEARAAQEAWQRELHRNFET
ncbi:uncharacterized protein N7529_003828 [Penicillium soppii]|uniref:uncharacterized protein n=1 Tax=Penicillium soppii TaxID=69789 RepID=UPI002546B306|nr:uncharacterized protein N7529_003828 [Penicillium soppii]KAJ5871475.1 hypothetical protein N7529_003828 [Penicillium soppii]